MRSLLLVLWILSKIDGVMVIGAANERAIRLPCPGASFSRLFASCCASLPGRGIYFILFQVIDLQLMMPRDAWLPHGANWCLGFRHVLGCCCDVGLLGGVGAGGWFF